MKNFLIIIILICAGTSVQAQEIILSGYDIKEWSETEKEAIRKVTPPAFKFPTEYALKTDSSTTTWQYLAQAKVSSFMYNVRSYSSPDKVNKAVACAYSVFGLANHAEQFSGAFEYFKKPEVVDAVFSIYKSKAYHESLYTWLQPSISAAWSSLEPRFKDTFREMLSYVIIYLQTLDIKKEAAYLKSNEAEFTYKDRVGKISPYRKGAAWCFRRINSGHMDKEYLLRWCFKIQNEIVSQ